MHAFIFSCVFIENLLHHVTVFMRLNEMITTKSTIKSMQIYHIRPDKCAKLSIDDKINEH